MGDIHIETNAVRIIAEGSVAPTEGSSAWSMKIGNAFLQGPSLITSRTRSNSEVASSTFQLAFGMEVRQPHAFTSWALYENDSAVNESWVPEHILYHARWDRTVDLVRHTRSKKSPPALAIAIRQMAESDNRDIFQRCQNLDSVLAGGLPFEQTSSLSDTFYISVTRRTRGKYFEVSWDPLSASNLKLEGSLFDLAKVIEQAFQEAQRQDTNRAGELVLYFESMHQDVFDHLDYVV